MIIHNHDQTTSLRFDVDVAGVFVMLRGKQVLGGGDLTASDRG